MNTLMIIAICLICLVGFPLAVYLGARTGKDEFEILDKGEK